MTNLKNKFIVITIILRLGVANTAFTSLKKIATIYSRCITSQP